jgi:transcriptional regulator with XRE-family HTH domain
MDKTWFAQQLQDFMRREGLRTQRQLADRLGESQPNVNRWLSGSFPSAEKQDQLFAKMGLRVGVGGEPVPIGDAAIAREIADLRAEVRRLRAAMARVAVLLDDAMAEVTPHADVELIRNQEAEALARAVTAAADALPPVDIGDTSDTLQGHRRPVLRPSQTPQPRTPPLHVLNTPRHKPDKLGKP